jgi:hypothetical protein
MSEASAIVVRPKLQVVPALEDELAVGSPQQRNRKRPSS